MTPFHVVGSQAASNQNCSTATASADFCRIKLKIASGSLIIRFRMPSANDDIIAESQVRMQLIANQAENKDQSGVINSACPSLFDSNTLSNMRLLQAVGNHCSDHNRNRHNIADEDSEDQTFETLEDLAEACCFDLRALNRASFYCLEYADLQPDFSPYHFWIEDSRCSESIDSIRGSKECYDCFASDIPDGSSLLSNILEIYSNICHTANPVPTDVSMQVSCNCAPKPSHISTDDMENSSVTDDIIEKEDPCQKYYGSCSSESATTTANSGSDNIRIASDLELIHLAASEMLQLQSPTSISNVLCSSGGDGDETEDDLSDEVASRNISTRLLSKLGCGARMDVIVQNLRTILPYCPRDSKRKRQQSLRRRAATTSKLAILLAKLIPARLRKTEAEVRFSGSTFHSGSCDNTGIRSPTIVLPLPLHASFVNLSTYCRKERFITSPKNKKREKRRCLPGLAVEILERWLHSHLTFPFPNKEEKSELALTTGLALSQVENWLSNARYKLKRTDETYKSRVDQVRRSLQLHRSQQKRGTKRKHVISSV